MRADAFRYDGKRALVVGGATGMGAAVAELVQDLGAEVVVMDFAPVTLAGAKAIDLDLRDKASIDKALDECGGPIHALFSCAGVADGTAGIEKINFIGHRHLIDRAIEQGSPRPRQRDRVHLVDRRPRLAQAPRRGKAYLATARLRLRGRRGSRRNPDKASYMWSKQSINVYVRARRSTLLKQGIRINAILPGPTDTPLARPTRRRGSASAPTTAATPGSRRHVPTSRPARSSSCAATRRRT